jgi:hypothetical protein
MRAWKLEERFKKMCDCRTSRVFLACLPAACLWVAWFAPFCRAEPTFLFSFQPCAPGLVAPPERSFSRTIDAVITTSDNPDAEDGAQGWSMSVSAEAVELVDITTAGTLSAPVEEGGLRDNGFEKSELADRGYGDCEGRTNNALSAVVLSFVRPVTLPPEGAARVARVTISAAAPAGIGQSVTARILYLDGCQGSGGPVDNNTTWRGQTVEPILRSCEFEIVAGEPPFLRGDTNEDGQVDISDVIPILECKFLGEECPTCRDAMDANDDGQDDVSDAITLLSFLYLGGDPPPAPGPFECGLDPTEDALAPCEYVRCLDTSLSR